MPCVYDSDNDYYHNRRTDKAGFQYIIKMMVQPVHPITDKSKRKLKPKKQFVQIKSQYKIQDNDDLEWKKIIDILKFANEFNGNNGVRYYNKKPELNKKYENIFINHENKTFLKEKSKFKKVKKKRKRVSN